MRLLIIDDHPLIAEAVEIAVSALRDDVSVRTLPTLEALDRVPPSEASWDLVLLDLNLPGHAGLASLAGLRTRLRDTPVVIFSAEDDAQTITEALRLGARGFIPKTSSHRVLIDALRLVLDGGVYVPPEVLAKVMAGGDIRGATTGAPMVAGATLPNTAHARTEPTPVGGTEAHGSRSYQQAPAEHLTEQALTERQREVLALLAEGLSTKEICRRLNISPNTAKTHIATIFRAYQVNTRAQLVAAIYRGRG